MGDVGLDLKLMELLPKPPALLSIAASWVFMRELWADRFYRGEKVIPRVLFALAFGGLLRSVGWFLTTWASPKELPYLWLNAGNTATCTFQGFIIHFGLQLCLGMYCFLFVCYLLILRYSWSDYKLARREKWGHGLVLVYAGGSAVLPLFWGMYNNYYPICWIAEYPLGCRGRFSYPDEFTSGGYPCIRGDKGWIVGEVYSYIPIWVTVITGIVTMSMIFCFVRSLERRNAEYAGSRSTQHMTVEMSTTFDRSERDRPPPEPLYINRKKSRAVAAQAYWYTGTFLAAWALDLVGSTMLYFGTFWWPPLTLVSFTLMPLQPTWNFLVFGRTREKMKTPEGRFLWKILCCCDCFCLSSTKKKWLKWLRSFSSSSEAEQGDSSNTQVRGNNNNKKNKNSGNGTDKTPNSQETPIKKQHDKNGKLSRASESVEIQFGPDSQFEPRSRAISESVEIAFGPDSQFEESAAVTSTVETTSTTMSSSQFGGYGSSGHGNSSFGYGSNDNNNNNSHGGGDMVEDEAPMIATTGDGDNEDTNHHHRSEENHTATDRSNGGVVSIIPPQQQPAYEEGGEADAAAFRDEVLLGNQHIRDNNATAEATTTTGTEEASAARAVAAVAAEEVMMVRACGGGRAAVTEVEEEDDDEDQSSGRRASF